MSQLDYVDLEKEDSVSVKKLAIGIAAGFGAIIAFMLLVLLFQTLGHVAPQDPTLVQERIKPTGQVKIEETAQVAEMIPAVPTTSKSAQEIYDDVCAACHTAGVLGAPKLGDKAAWADRIAKGEATLINNAINGLNVMPPRGGHADLSDDEVKRTVLYMLEALVPPPSLKSGQEVYETKCKVCHEAGVAGAPKYGDQAAWIARIEKGEATLIQNAINGLNAMPPRGGHTDLHDEEVKGAVLYMLAAIQPHKASMGEEVYKTGCAICHNKGIVGAPTLGDKDNWAPRVAKGMDTLLNNALQGFKGNNGVMPAKGGQAQLSDDDVKAAVAYMLEAAGVETTPPKQDLAQGEKVYQTGCAICHNKGIVGAPTLGDKETWTQRVAKGMDALLSNAVQGFKGETGVMPPKGGHTQLSDEDIEAAVAYMISKS